MDVVEQEALKINEDEVRKTLKRAKSGGVKSLGEAGVEFLTWTD